MPHQAPGRARRPRRQPRVGLGLTLLSAWVGLIWAAAVPPMAAPDEPAFLQAVMELRTTYRLPEIHFDFRQDPAGRLVGSPGDAAARAYAQQAGISDALRLVPYQAVQPPLYILAAALVALPFPPDPARVLYLSRLVAVLFGAGTVYFCWAAARQVAPGAPQWAVAAAGAVLLLPGFCFNNGRVGNDCAANFAAAGAFYCWFRGLREPGYDPRLLRAGAWVGLAILGKLTALALLPGLALVLIFRAFQVDGGVDRGRVRLRRALRMAGGASAAFFVVAGWWFVHNLLAYGEISGTANDNQWYKAVLPWFDFAQQDVRDNFTRGSWEGFWGVFGWFSVGLPADLYQQAIYMSLGLAGLSGLAALIAVGRRALGWGRPIPSAAWQAVLVSAVVAAVLLVSYVAYSITVVYQAQGRYLYPLLVPAALLFTGGLNALVPGRRRRALALSLPLLWLAALNVVGLALLGR